MNFLKTYNIIKLLALVSFIALAYKYVANGLVGVIFMLIPYVLIFFLANKNAYQTTLKVSIRMIGGILVVLLALSLLFYVNDDAQAGIGIMFAVVIQYGVIFVSEAIIGLLTYERNSAN